MSTPDVCFLHREHRPRPVQLVTHHVVPLGMGGPDEPDNKRLVCDTGHRNVHAHLAAWVHGKPAPAVGTATERALALLGFQRWSQMGRPGNPHAAYALHSAQHPSGFPVEGEGL